MTIQPVRIPGGEILRHWTTDTLSFVGGRQEPGPSVAQREAADRSRLALDVSRLQSLKAIAVGILSARSKLEVRPS